MHEIASEEQPGHCQHKQHFFVVNFTATHGAPQG
ncbi:hypothetical protein Cabther_B0740 [Chloracidobacterium thermophilum B]|uniref:Uncharacterized protein n=1 Tax=Chloracidobacterium thermophilum (strain B) TaxID=981222 RepID=G2LL61_CHLTF|nr:hypothetical protein Cabther_B0740 [Chloracidobacterium thermophilum B]